VLCCWVGRDVKKVSILENKMKKYLIGLLSVGFGVGFLFDVHVSSYFVVINTCAS
jgi:hypothetical protein